MERRRSAILRRELLTRGKLLSRESIPETWLPTAALRSCKTVPRSQLQNSSPLGRVAAQRRVEVLLLEPVATIHYAAGRDLTSDGRDYARRDRGLYTATGFRAARGRLPNNSSGHLLSGRQSDRDGDYGDRAAGAAVWPVAGPEPDDLHKFWRNVGHCSAV